MFGGELRWPTLESNGHAIPPMPTSGVTDFMQDCILQLDILKGQRSQKSFWIWRKNVAHEGGTVLTLCLATLNNVISDSVRLWANQSFCYWSSSGDYSSRTFDIGWRQKDPARVSSSLHCVDRALGTWSQLGFLTSAYLLKQRHKRDLKKTR